MDGVDDHIIGSVQPAGLSLILPLGQEKLSSQKATP